MILTSLAEPSSPGKSSPQESIRHQPEAQYYLSSFGGAPETTVQCVCPEEHIVPLGKGGLLHLKQAKPDSEILSLQLQSKSSNTVFPGAALAETKQDPLLPLLGTFMGPSGLFGKKLYI